MRIESVCVFCGSDRGTKPVYEATARAMGKLLAERGVRLVYGGGNIGLMGVVADAAMGSGGTVVGVIPKALADKELAHHGITELYVVESMHERKSKMASLSDAFVALPGGYGTLEEFCEIVTWSQLGIHAKPVGLLNVEGYYDAMLRQFDHGVAESFIRPQHRDLVLASDTPDGLFGQLASYTPSVSEKWITDAET
jgi:uncharacterized protein (TIGR00730 family)